MLHFKPNTDLFSITDGLQELLRCKEGKEENFQAESFTGSNTVLYSVTSAVDTVSIVANRGSQKDSFFYFSSNRF